MKDERSANSFDLNWIGNLRSGFNSEACKDPRPKSWTNYTADLNENGWYCIRNI